MFIELEPVFNNIGLSLDFDYQLDMSECEFAGVRPFGTPVRVKGCVRNNTGIVELAAEAVFTVFAPCDRCAAEPRGKQKQRDHEAPRQGAGRSVEDPPCDHAVSDDDNSPADNRHGKQHDDERGHVYHYPVYSDVGLCRLLQGDGA